MSGKSNMQNALNRAKNAVPKPSIPKSAKEDSEGNNIVWSLIKDGLIHLTWWSILIYLVLPALLVPALAHYGYLYPLTGQQKFGVAFLIASYFSYRPYASMGGTLGRWSNFVNRVETITGRDLDGDGTVGGKKKVSKSGEFWDQIGLGRETLDNQVVKREFEPELKEKVKPYVHPKADKIIKKPLPGDLTPVHILGVCRRLGKRTSSLESGLPEFNMQVCGQMDDTQFDSLLTHLSDMNVIAWSEKKAKMLVSEVGLKWLDGIASSDRPLIKINKFYGLD